MDEDLINEIQTADALYKALYDSQHFINAIHTKHFNKITISGNATDVKNFLGDLEALKNIITEAVGDDD